MTTQELPNNGVFREESMRLPGLEQLLETCRTRNMGLVLLPPRQQPLAAGVHLAGHPLDPVLASLYTRLGRAVFAPEEAGLTLYQLDDEVNDLENHNRTFQEDTQPWLGMPLFAFGGEIGLATSYATVPSLADERGHQPVVLVDCYEQPFALPVASDVDKLFESYATFLKVRVSHPEHHEPGDATLVFPWHVPEILACDERLVALLRAGRFNPLLKETDEVREWVARILQSASRGRAP